MPYQRDPLSVGLDEMAADVISRAIRAHKSSRSKANPRWVPVIFTSPEGYREREPAGAKLTRMERAWSRALYHDKRIHKARKGTGGDWSLQLDWGELIGATRMMRVRVFSDTSAARKVRKDGTRKTSYVKNPELRSTFAADQQERMA